MLREALQSEIYLHNNRPKNYHRNKEQHRKKGKNFVINFAVVLLLLAADGAPAIVFRSMLFQFYGYSSSLSCLACLFFSLQRKKFLILFPCCCALACFYCLAGSAVIRSKAHVVVICNTFSSVPLRVREKFKVWKPVDN